MHQVVAYKRLKTMENYKQPPMKFGHGCFKEVVVFNCKGRYTLGDKLQQHVAVTHCSEKSLRVYWKICVKISVSATEFVAATCCKKSNQTEFVRLVAATKFCCRDKEFHQISPVDTKLFVAAMCRPTCCCN